jgi:hypothetical protein
VERLASAGIVVVEETVRQWARAERLNKVVLPSGRYLFRPEDIDAIISGRGGSGVRAVSVA